MSDKKIAVKSELLSEKSKNKREATSLLLEDNESVKPDHLHGGLH